MDDEQATAVKRVQSETRLTLATKRGAHPATPRIVRAALDAALEALEAPACVIDCNGVVLCANAAARRALEDPASNFATDLRRALERVETQSRFELREIGCPEGDCALVIDRLGRAGSESDGRRAEAAIQRAARRWGLTAKQTRVLGLLAEGHPNKTIALRLACAENTVEYHVTRLLAKAEKESRAELIAELWRSA